MVAICPEPKMIGISLVTKAGRPQKHSASFPGRFDPLFVFRTIRRPVVLFGGLLICLLLLFFGQGLRPNHALVAGDLVFELDPLWQGLAPDDFVHAKNHALSDQAFQYFPWRLVTFQSLQQGRIPLWTPTINGGHPFVGNGQTGVFDPLNLVSFLFGFYPSFAIVAMLRLFLIGLFTFLFARAVGISTMGAGLAMVAFTFCAANVTSVSMPRASVAAWLPCLLFLTERLVRTNYWHTAGLLGLVIGLQYLGGHLQTSFHLLAVTLGYGLFRLYTARMCCTLGRMRQTLGKLLTSFVMGTLVGAIQTLPTVAAILASDTIAARDSQPFTFQNAFFAWRSWLAAVTAVLPDYFGDPVNDNYWYPGPANYIELNLYTGIIPLALAATVLFALFSRARPNPAVGHGQRAVALFFAFLGLTSLAVALKFPVFHLLDWLPLFELVNHDRLRIVYSLSLALLAGFGLDMLVYQGHHTGAADRTVRRFHVMLIGIAFVGLFLSVASLIGLTILRDQVIGYGQQQVAVQLQTDSPYFPESPDYYANLVVERFRQMVANFRPTNWQMYMPVLLALAYFIAARRLSGSVRFNRTGLPALLLLLTTADVVTFGYGWNPTNPHKEIFPLPPAVAYLREAADEPSRVIGLDLTLAPNSAMTFGLHDARGYEHVSSARYMTLVAQLEGNRRFINVSLFGEADAPLLDLFNVEHVITQERLQGKWLAVFDDGATRVYRNPDVLARAFFVCQVDYVESAEEALSTVTDPNYDFRHRIVLEAAEPEDRLVSAGGCPDDAGQVHVRDYDSERVILDVTAAVDGYVFMSDVYLPGWRATVDGVEEEVVIADYAFRAVAVPAGTHQLEFFYRPRSFLVGVWLTSAGMAAVGLLLLWPQLRNRIVRRRPSI